MKKFFILTVLLMSISAFAKKMPQRLGVGIKNNTTQSIPSLAGVYNVSGDFSLLGGFGFDTQKDYSTLEANFGVRHIIFHEANMHFYTGGQFAMVNVEDPVNGKENGFEVNFIVGVEFFLAGLENLGFSFEGGLGLVSFKETRMRTVADNPLRAGMIFYF